MKPKKTIQPNAVVASRIDDLQNIQVGNDYSETRKIGPILDTDAYDMMYPTHDNQVQKYAMYLDNIIGKKKTIEGNLLEPERKEEWTSIFDMTKINLMTENKEERTKSVARIGIILGLTGIIVGSKKLNLFGIIIGIIVAFILFSSFKLIEGFSFNSEQRIHTDVPYQPRNGFNSEATFNRMMIPVNQYQNWVPKKQISSNQLF